MTVRMNAPELDFPSMTRSLSHLLESAAKSRPPIDSQRGCIRQPELRDLAANAHKWQVETNHLLIVAAYGLLKGDIHARYEVRISISIFGHAYNSAIGGD